METVEQEQTPQQLEAEGWTLYLVLTLREMADPAIFRQVSAAGYQWRNDLGNGAAIFAKGDLWSDRMVRIEVEHLSFYWEAA